jgi:hypothetical protein
VSARDCNSCAWHEQESVPSLCKDCLDAPPAGEQLPYYEPKAVPVIMHPRGVKLVTG